MSNVSRIRHELSVSPDIVVAVNDFDAALAQAIETAKVAEIPQGLLVGLLQGHAHAEVHKMISQ